MIRIISIIAICFAIFPARSSHIVGGEIYYDYLGNNQYKIYINVFRDCLSSGADFDGQLPLGIFYANSNNLYQQLEVPYVNKTNVPVTFSNPCVIPPTNICTENSLYTTIVTLPPTPGGYIVSYVRCCRGPNINNLVNPEDTGLTLAVNIPTSQNSFYINSSPRFNSYPPMLLCSNDALYFDHSATEPDGDSLVYSLTTPYQGGSSFNPMPMPTPNPPYQPIYWANGHSYLQPLGPGSNLTINPQTGVLTGNPNLTGRYVVGVRVQEYRNGTLISTMTRDFIFQVFNCNIIMDAILPTQQQLPSFNGFCNGNTAIAFINNSYGGSHYEWDFGDPTTTSDVSTAFQPSYNYPDTGTYIVRLVVNPGWNCTDTTYMTIHIYDELTTQITHSDSLCLQDNLYNFNVVPNMPLDNTTYLWNFGPTSNPATSTTQTAQTTFSTMGNKQIILKTNFKVCEKIDTINVYVRDEPIANFSLPPNHLCEGLTIDFINNTQNATIHTWDFGVPGGTSTEQSPTFTFPTSGTYPVIYTAASSPMCVDSFVMNVTVNEDLVVSFTQSPDQCITGNSFDFIGTIGGPPHATFTYTFGPNASVNQAPGPDVLGVVYNAPGVYPVVFTGSFDNCSLTADSTVTIYAEPTIGFGIDKELQCSPYPAKFINYSTADTPMEYQWDFGDGNTSTEREPLNIYVNPGNYSVTLSVSTAEGCINTLSLTQVDLIDVKPSPIASYVVSSDEITICEPVVHFTNTSIGAISYYYRFDDGKAFSFQEHPFHYYLTTGDHYTSMVAYSDAGCTDTAYQKIYVEPYSVWVPNTFTPNGDEFNALFKVKTWEVPIEWEFKIFNRWGTLIFETTDFEATWDGTYNGKAVQSGEYVYILNYQPCSPEQLKVELTGHINVLR